MRKCVVIGVTGGIAAFKACQLVSNLKKKNYEIHVIMTKNATEFVAPLTFESLSGNRVSVDTFDRNFEYNVQHISLAKKADAFVIAPATANVIAKIVHGIADDMLSTTFLAASCKKIICPAMNTGMLNNPVTVENIEKCKQLGYMIVDAESGMLACGDEGKGKLADVSIIEDAIEYSLYPKPLQGKKVLVTAGPTQEAIDPVRYITNHSSGKMGYAIAKAARNLGADVLLITGETNLTPCPMIQTIEIKTAKEMFDEVTRYSKDQDCIIKAAAVADYTVIDPATNKIKKKDNTLTIELTKTDDILAYLGQNKKAGQILCGFAMETENLIENAKEKCIKKNCDLLVANNLSVDGAGFKTNTNVVTIIRPNEIKELELMSKEKLAYQILKECFRGEIDVIND
ncbi:bifunctional phosphopantothenoylcysteine decarboxylase/phosphopantothenate--cysteine ligase CoaBC [Anaerorhabdus sp.]|uniref:bifunctional phosphopantothenoylcysteine decarboxylase/phosphopantothenate--cysteine ligase CoaBC n=1 Tax=Anaerorhabdus sp. TaxID=1872524 RepID=UPI002FCA3572